MDTAQDIALFPAHGGGSSTSAALPPLASASAPLLEPVLEAAAIGWFSGAWPPGEMTCSPACLAHFGLPMGESAGFEMLAACLLPEDRRALRRALADNVEGGAADGRTTQDCRLCTAPGPQSWVNVTWQVRRDVRGEPCGWDGITRDISAAYQAEAEREGARQAAGSEAAALSREAAAMSLVYAREHRIAEALQRSLLQRPSPDALLGLEVETVYRAAWDEALVGGDFYDIFALAGGKVALVVGDVSGKGLEAASRTAEIKYTLRAYLREYPHPALALERLNGFLCEARALEGLQSDTFVCLTLAVLNPQTGALEICAAGAEPAYLLRASGETTMLREGGLPLGVADRSEYVAAQEVLEQEDVLLVVTDGLTEARQGALFLGEEGVQTLARQSLAAGPLAQAGQAILAGAQEFADRPLHDDVCMLLARRGV